MPNLNLVAYNQVKELATITVKDTMQLTYQCQVFTNKFIRFYTNAYNLIQIHT